MDATIVLSKDLRGRVKTTLRQAAYQTEGGELGKIMKHPCETRKQGELQWIYDS
jgi:hypothetical protein